MKRTNSAAALLLIAVLGVVGCRSAAKNQQQESTQSNFGVRMAKINLWREALFRFQRAVELNPSDAMAHNNLAVAYEANGEFEKALREYREAIRLDKSNQFIQKNYSRFVEFTSRNRKRQQKTPPAATTASAPANAAPASSTPATPTAPAPAAGEGKSTPPPPGSVASPAPAGTAPASTPPPNPQPQPKPPGDRS